MKIYTSVLLFLSVFVASCTESEEEIHYGYLQLEAIKFCVDKEVIPLSRAVDASLRVQILQNNLIVQDYAPGTDFSKRITLPVGENYIVRAFTPDQDEAINDVAGYPVYCVECDAFNVKEADITTITLIAPQINVGISVVYDEFVTTNFTEISVVVASESGRSVKIAGIEDHQIRYFNLPSSGQLTYTLWMTNADGENLSKTETLTVTAKNYDIRVSI